MTANDQYSRLTDDEIDGLFSESTWAERFPPVMSPDQAAELVQIPKQTLYDWSSRGLLGDCSFKAGKHLRIFRNRFLKLLASGGFSHAK